MLDHFHVQFPMGAEVEPSHGVIGSTSFSVFIQENIFYKANGLSNCLQPSVGVADVVVGFRGGRILSVL
jgi:hypothetical protein